MRLATQQLIASILVLCSLTSAFAATPEKTKTAGTKPVILISVDGLGDHLLQKSDAPNIKKLAELGMKAPHALTLVTPLTVPSHVSMLTGVDGDRHKRYENSLTPNLLVVDVPTIFDLLKQNGFKTAAILGKGKLKRALDTGSIDSIQIRSWPVFGDYVSRSPTYIEWAARKELEENRPDFMFVHFGYVDFIGHGFGWEGRAQLDAVNKVDEKIGSLIDAATKAYGRNGFVVILTADHGGHGTAHGQRLANGDLEDPNDRVIPWIIYGARLRPDIKTTDIYDTAATVASLFKVEVPAAWKWQGRSLLQN